MTRKKGINMQELRDLYQEVILDHNRKPRNFHAIADASHQAEGFNPLCGDQLKVFLKTKGDLIEDVSFEGSGCAISQASASMMTEFLKGKSTDEVLTTFEKFHHMVTGEINTEPDPDLGKLAVFAGVCEFPTRVKCASLAWHTLKSALKGGKQVSTE